MPPTTTSISTLSAASPGLTALLEDAAFATLDSIGWVRVTGEDRVRWLNGMVTNSIQALTPGEGCYNFVLNAQGRIQGDLIAWMLADSLLLETSRPAALASWLDHYIIMDDVELTVLTSTEAAAQARTGLLVAGPDAASALSDLIGDTKLPEPLRFISTAWQSAALEIFHAPSPLVPRFELWSENPETLDNIAAALLGDNISQATNVDLEHLRLLEGTPLYGTDIRDKDLPQETAQTCALHFSKGCYLGQEIVERIHSRGAVHRTFTGFLIHGDVPPAGTPLAAADAPEKRMGELTSATHIDLPEGPITLGLGYIRRDVLERKVPLVYSGGGATPSTLPFPLAARNESSRPKSASEPEAATQHSV